MDVPKPLYTPDNCHAAYQLNWAISFFGRQPLPAVDDWLASLCDVAETDGVRVLEARLASPADVQFLVSTQPSLCPAFILQRLKGRLQYLLRDRLPKAFHRNYRLESIGSARREVIEQYVRNQTVHHRMADPRVQERLEWFQIVQQEVDLSKIRYTAHGQFIYNLHLVLEHADGWNAVEPSFLEATQSMVLNASRKHRYLLAEAGIVADHLHQTLGCSIEDSPEAVALSFLNNLAYAHGMKPIYRHGYYVGSFGNMDLGAIRNAHEADDRRTNRLPASAAGEEN